MNLASFESLHEKYDATVDFHPFFIIEPLSAKEFRAERINLPDYTAIVFSSRHAIDAYFELCDQMRFKVPDSMKYFCSTEAVAMYLQKHIVFRKRKIFYGDGSPSSIINLIGAKHKAEKFLIASIGANSDRITSLFDEAKLDYKLGVLVKAVSQDLHDIDLKSYKLIVMFNTYDVASLKDNFPNFKQGDIQFVSFGNAVVGAMEEAGLKIAVKAPSPTVPSVAKAIEICIEGHE